MTRPSTLARNVRIAFGLSLIIGGLMHGSGYGTMVPLVQDVGNDAKVIFPALWLGYAWHLAMLGVMVLLVDGGWMLPALVALVAIGDGLTHIAYFGYSPSEVLLFTIATLGIAAAWLRRQESSTA